MKTNQNHITQESTTDDKEFVRLKEMIELSSLSYQNLQVHMIRTFNEIGNSTEKGSSARNGENLTIR